MQRFRSMLFAPGNKSELLRKLPKIQPDAAIVDLEDAVPNEEKENARKNREGAKQSPRSRVYCIPETTSRTDSHIEGAYIVRRGLA